MQRQTSLDSAVNMRPADLPDDVPRYDLLVVGLGPGGAAAALAARQLGLSTLAIEARGPEATRAQLVLVRPRARAALARIGLVDITEGRRTTTIRQVENRLRSLLEEGRGAEGFEHRWHKGVAALAEADDHVAASLRDESGGRHWTMRARHVIDASGSRPWP
jgi:flavin-dependent dehydrogenase